MLRVDDAAQTAARLLTLGIRVRNCASFGYPQHIRVATRMPEVDKVLVEAITPAKSKPSRPDPSAPTPGTPANATP